MTKNNPPKSLTTSDIDASENTSTNDLDQVDALPLRFFTIRYTAAAPAGLPPFVVATGLSELHVPRRLVEFSFQTPGHGPRTVLVLQREHVDEIREEAPPVAAA